VNVTPAMVKLCYALLVKLPPFTRWKMPAPDAVKFYLLSDVASHAMYESERGHHISVNADTHITLEQLLATVAHEMVHLRQELIGRLPATRDPHNGAFRRAAKQVCQQLGFDVQAF
jgi:hypothetical protein